MLENRPIVTATLGYIIGIIMGLYCKINIVFFYLSFYLIYLLTMKKEKINEFKLLSVKRYKRYLKILFTKKVKIIIIIFSIISNIIVLYQNSKYQKLYNELENKEITLQGIIGRMDNDKYHFKITKGKYKNLCFYLKFSNYNLVKNLNCGEEIIIRGVYELPAERSNYKGFDYRKYLKTVKIAGTIKVNKLIITKNKKKNYILKTMYELCKLINFRIESLNIEPQEKEILKGIIIGDKKDISNELKDNFAKSNISYILAISGIHILYISYFFSSFFNKVIGRNYSKPVTSIFILIYIGIVNFAPSVVRAGITAIITIMSNFFYRKNDTFEALSFSFLIILIYNPYLLLNIGLQLSFAGTLGIIAVSPILKNGITQYIERLNNKARRKNNKKIIFCINIFKTKFIQNMQNAIIITFSANFLIMPIIVLNFNVISLTSLFISSIASFIVGPIIICGFLSIIIKLKILDFILSKLIKMLLLIANFGSKIYLNQIYFITPNLISIIIYYIIFFILIFILKINLEKNPNAFYKRMRNLINVVKYKIIFNKKKVISSILVFCIIISLYLIVPQKLKIYFIDVGQGDSCLIVTPKNKTILIDGGGIELKDFNVGEKTLLPYLLSRKITKIDYVIISHFDTDHVQRNFIFNGKYKSEKCVIFKTSRRF